METKISSYFNKFASTYNNFAFDYSLGTKYLSQLEKNFVLTFFGNLNNKRVLDIGVGTGRVTSWLLSGGALVECIDTSKEMVRKAKAKLKGNKIAFKVADAGTELPFEKESFDYVVGLRVLKYIQTWKKSIQEIYRILKPRGVVILTFPNLYSVAYFGGKNANYFLFKRKEVKNNLERCGFNILSVECESRLPFQVYRLVNNPFELKVVKVVEKFLDILLPPTIFSRRVFVACRKDLI